MIAEALPRKPRPAGHRVPYAAAAQWLMRLAAASYEKHLETHLRKREHTPLILFGEAGYLPFAAETANLPALGRRHMCSSSLFPPTTDEPR